MCYVGLYQYCKVIVYDGTTNVDERLHIQYWNIEMKALGNI